MDWFLYDNDPIMKQLKGFIKYNLTGRRRNIWVKLCLFHFQFFFISDFFISDFNGTVRYTFFSLVLILSFFSLVQFVPLFFDFSDFIFFYFFIYFLFLFLFLSLTTVNKRTGNFVTC